MARRLHNQNRFRYVLAGGKPEDWPEYEGPEDGQQFGAEQWLEVEARLAASPFVRRAPAPAVADAEGPVPVGETEPGD